MNRESLKPFIWGVVLGSAALAIVGFSAGWVVTGGANDRLVRTAWVDGQASACVTLAQAHRASIGDVADLSNYAAREARETLAKAYTVILPGEETADSGVINACADLLKVSSTS